MAKSLMLLCKFGMFPIVIHFIENMRYDDFVRQVCSKWKTLSLNMVCLTYALPGHAECLLNSDSYLLSLSMLEASMGMEGVNVFVSELSELDDGNKEDDEDDLGEDTITLVHYEGTDMETDFIPQFCLYKEKILLFSDWANGIRHVGQRFEGGVAEPRGIVSALNLST